MDKAQHTPGPHSVDSGESVKIRDADGGCLATMSFTGNGGKFGGRRNGEEVLATAHLYASAADMYAALERAESFIVYLLTHAPEEADENGVVQQIRAALTAARGEGDGNG